MKQLPGTHGLEVAHITLPSSNMTVAQVDPGQTVHLIVPTTAPSPLLRTTADDGASLMISKPGMARTRFGPSRITASFKAGFLAV